MGSEISDEAKRYLTGTKKPTRLRLCLTIIFILLGLLASGVFGFYLHLYLSDLSKQPDLFASVGVLDKDEISYFFPITLINSGQKELSNVMFSFQNCYMEKPMNYKYDLMIPSQIEPIKFRDKKTMDIITKKACMPEYNFSVNDCDVKVYKLNDTNVYVPPMNCSVYICDFCYYSLRVGSDQMNEYKNFSGRFFAPKEIRLKVAPKTILNVSVDSLEEYSPVSFNFFNWKEICMWDGTCSVYELPDYATVPVFPMDITLNPKDPYQTINITIDYLETVGNALGK